MALSGKYGQVTASHGDLGEDEPVFVIRAKDALACPAISAYHRLCEKNGAAAVHLARVEAVYSQVADWQEAHAGQVKLPDSGAGQ